MKKPPPPEIEEMLWKDAARFPDAAFDPALHHATIRRIRSLSECPRPLISRPWLFSSSAAAILLTLVLIAAFWNPQRPTPPALSKASAPAVHVHSAPFSVWSYHRAALEGDDALLARLDVDSRSLLTPTSSVFSESKP